MVSNTILKRKKIDNRKVYGKQAFWWKENKGDLSVVTDEAHNDALGIKKIQLFPATKNQMELGIVCKVRMVSLTGIDDNITVFQSEDHEDDIYLMMNSRKVGGKYYRDRRLNRAAEAQILRYAHKHLVPIE